MDVVSGDKNPGAAVNETVTETFIKTMTTPELKSRHIFLDAKVHPAIASSELGLFRGTPNTVWHSCVFVIEKNL